MAVGTRSFRGRLALTAALALASAALALLSGFDAGLLTMLPALLMAATLLIWPHPGLELIVRIAGRRRARRLRGAPRRRRHCPRSAPGGGRLISLSLGGRAPPRLAGCG